MSHPRHSGLESDLDVIVDRTAAAWHLLGGARILLTGGSGYFGRWFAAALDHADRRLGLGCRLAVVARRPAALIEACPFLADSPSIELIPADVRSMPAPSGQFTHVIHAATVVERQSSTPDTETVDVCHAGTRRVLEIAAEKGVAGVLVTSSGAVYGPQPADVDRIPESYRSAAPPRSAYAEGKLLSERVAREAAAGGLPVCIARCFAQAGPYLPLDCHFALGNFVRDSLQGREIVVSGDGLSVRTYLYSSDLVEWLVTLLARGCRAGEPTCVNVGSEEPITIGDLARLVADTDHRCGGRRSAVPVRIAGGGESGVAGTRYVPDCSSARHRFALEARVPIADAVERMLRWGRTAGAHLLNSSLGDHP
jgi:dTDP-glucose 4,6-dehydratase